MTFLAVVICTAVACAALKPLVCKAPWALYLAAVLADALYFWGASWGLPTPITVGLVVLMGKCMLPTALFVVVMYIGTLPKGSHPRAWMQPLRAPLSLAACILALGHMVRYFGIFAPRITAGVPVAANIMASFVMAFMMFALLAMLGITSLGVVRHRMSTHTWKRMQRWAYLFYALVYVHVLIMLAPAAAAGGQAALEGIAVYTVIFGCYGALRAWQRKAHATERAVARAPLDSKALSTD